MSGLLVKKLAKLQEKVDQVDISSIFHTAH